MHRFVLGFSVIALFTVGCGDDSGGGAGTGGDGGDLEWPPDATAYFDDHDILNADCATDEDCAMVLGYYHASERFVQMDVRRRFSTGRLADILAKPVAESLVFDFADIRASFSTQDGQPLEDHLVAQTSPKTLALFEAYSAGVNQWLADLRNGEPGAVFPREFEHVLLDYSPEDVPPWTPKDCGASIIALVDSLTNAETEETRAGVARAEIDDDDRFSDLWSRRPLENSSILPPGWMPPDANAASLTSKRMGADFTAFRRRLNPIHALRQLRDKLERIEGLFPMLVGTGALSGSDVGSNNWVLAPDRTTNGNALLSNDPHLGMTQPATWYLAHLDAKTNGSGDFHSAGVSFAGIPWVLIGQNENIAWGMTTTNMDYTDMYVEHVVRNGEGVATGVMFQDEAVDFTHVPWAVTFNDGSTFEFCDDAGCDAPALLFVTHHGPVRQILEEAPADPADDVALTLRWTGQDISTDINFLTELNAASNLDEARTALELMTTVGQNVVVIDPAGEIGWFPYAQLPKRTWATDLDGDAPPWLPLDGRGDYEWTQYFPLSELPQLENPADGYIVTANNDMTGALFDGDPTSLGPPYQVAAAAGFRSKRIVDLIEGIGSEHTVATMNAIVSDVYSLMGERMRPGLLAIIDDPEIGEISLDGGKVVNALEAWNFTCPTGLDGAFSNSPLVSDAAELLESSGCTAFHALLNELRARIEANEYAPSMFNENVRGPSFATYFSIVDPTQLIAGDVYWDDPGTLTVEETKQEVMAEALNFVGDFLVTTAGLGSDEKKWAWGILHGLRLESDLGAFLGPVFDNPAPGDPNWANDGGLYTVDVAAPDPQDFTQNWGASTRFVCEMLPDGPKCTYQLPGGQSGDIDSEFYQDLLFPYLENEPLDVVFDINVARDTAKRTVTFD